MWKGKGSFEEIRDFVEKLNKEMTQENPIEDFGFLNRMKFEREKSSILNEISNVKNQIVLANNSFRKDYSYTNIMGYLGNNSLLTTADFFRSLYEISIPFVAFKPFQVWIGKEDETEWVSGQRFGVVPVLIQQYTVGHLIGLNWYLFNSPFAYNAGYRKFRIMSADADIVKVHQSNIHGGSFNIVNEYSWVKSSSPEYNVSTSIPANDYSYYDLLYITTSNMWVKGGMAFFEGGNSNDGFCGVYFTIGGANLRIACKASPLKVGSSMVWTAIEYSIKNEITFKYDASINKNVGVFQKVCDLPEFPKFIRIWFGSSTEWFQDDISHYYNHTNLGATATDTTRMGGSNTKMIKKNGDKYELWVRFDGYFEGLGYPTNRVRVICYG